MCQDYLQQTVTVADLVACRVVSLFAGTDNFTTTTHFLHLLKRISSIMKPSSCSKKGSIKYVGSSITIVYIRGVSSYRSIRSLFLEFRY